MQILIVRLAALGDVAMALSVLPAIDVEFPGAHITWLCGKAAAPLVEATGRVSEVIAVDETSLLAGSWARRMVALCGTWHRLAGRRFDLIVTAHPDPRYRYLTIPVRTRERRGFTRRAGERPWPVPGRYHGDEYARLITRKEGPAGDHAPLPVMPLPLPESLRARLDSLPAGRVALAPGGARNVLRDTPLKRWPLPAYADLARRLTGRGLAVVLTGSDSDRWVLDAFRDIETLDLIGETSVLELAAVFAACTAVVTHDSGPMHLARLARAPLVALFGPTSPGEFAPTDSRTVILWGGARLACRPCYDGKRFADCRDNLCMQDLSPARVEAEVVNLVNRTAADTPASSRRISS